MFWYLGLFMGLNVFIGIKEGKDEFIAFGIIVALWNLILSWESGRLDRALKDRTEQTV